MGIETSYSDLARELERRRAILHEYARKAGELPPGNSEKHEPFAEELKKIAADIRAEIDRLQRERPSDWQAKNRQLDARFTELKEKIDGASRKLPSEMFLG